MKRNVLLIFFHLSLWLCSPARAMASSFTRFLDHTQRRATVGGEILWTSDQIVAETSTEQHTTHTTDKQPCLPVGFEPTIAAGERPKTYVLDRVATGTGNVLLALSLLMSYICGAPCKATNFNVVFIWTYVWQRWKPSLIYLLHNVSTLNQCRKFSCVTVVSKHFVSYQGYPNYRWYLIR
jgi:hypothetical protein